MSLLAAFFTLILLSCTWSVAQAMNETCPTPGSSGCYVVKDYWPIKSCQLECATEICERGWGAWGSNDVCCAPGVAFPEGCGKKMKNCWVVENFAVKTCKQDQRKCLQGYGVYPSEEKCCKGAFKQNCTVLPVSPTPCWVVDSYFPSRLCTSSSTLCGEQAKNAGVQSWPSKDECCAPGGAFQEGCSTSVPPTPCWVINSYYPVKNCRLESDVAACNRGWGVYETEDICCSPNVAFPEGCTAPANSSATSPMADDSEEDMDEPAPAATTPAPAPAATTPTPAPAATTPAPAPAATTPAAVKPLATVPATPNVSTSIGAAGS